MFMFTKLLHAQNVVKLNRRKADWDGLRDHLSGVLGRDIFKHEASWLRR